MYKMLSIQELFKINQYAQNYAPINEAISWFKSCDQKYQQNIVYNLLNLVIQSGAKDTEIYQAACMLKKTKSTAAVMLLNPNKPFFKYGYEICKLKENDLVVGFDILIHTLSISDTRRKNEVCRNSCSHWWHKDLSKEITQGTVLCVEKDRKTGKDKKDKTHGDGSLVFVHA